MKKVKAIYGTEIWYLFYMNNILVETFTEYQHLVDYCSNNGLNLVKSKGI